MKKIIILTIALLSLTAASCDLFSTPNAGIMRTSNGGIDWQTASKLKDGTGTLLNLSVSKLAFDPQGEDVLYASAYNGGIYASHDGASTWEEILGLIPVMDFVINPNDNQTIYASGTFEEKGRALVTRDGGKSWNAIYTSGTSNSAVRAIALNPANTQQIAIGMAQGELIMSNDAGASWKLVQSYNDRINRIIWTFDGMYVVVKGTGVSKSVDGGNSFQLITSNLQSPGNTSTLAIFGSSVSSFNELAISKSNPSTMYLTTNLGLYKSVNGGSSWGFVPMPLRQSAVTPQAVAVAPNSDNVAYVSAGPIVYKTADGGQTWSASESGAGKLVSALLVDPNLPQVAYAGGYK